LLLVACGGGSSGTTKTDGSPVDMGSGGSGVDASVDAKVYMDAHISVPAMITISGIATQQAQSGSMPAADVLIGAYRSSNPSTAVATATSDAQGKFMMTITTNGAPLDGYLKATKNGNVDTYLYPPAPLVADFTNASVNELDTGTFSLLTLIGQAQDQPLIAALVTDAAAAPVAGASVSSTPAAHKTGYSGSGNPPLPDTTATSTKGDGRAYLFGMPVGSATVSATKTGVTFKTHSVGVFAGSFTTTVITE
jgi:hypothetical protein